MTRISIAREFSETPLGRYHPLDGPNTGERFREEFLVPALRGGPVTVDIDGTEGYGSSFLDEAFGGLVREGYFTAQELKDALTVEGNEPTSVMYKKTIWSYISEARRAATA